MKRVGLLLGGMVVAIVAVMLLRRDEVAAGATSTRTAAVDAAHVARAPAAAERPQRARADAIAPTQPASRFVVAFRLDPNVTRGLYLGDRWVSPPTFAFAQPGDRYVVHARVQPIDDDGGAPVPAQWATTDPEMVEIAREADGAVTIAIDRPGTAQVQVRANGEAKVLEVAARKTGDAMEVEFRQ